jgi:TPR repeat protein
MCNYGTCLKNGDGVDQDLISAAHYHKMGADLGDSDSLYNYAVCLDHGEGVEQDEASAARYFRMSADLGNPGAMCQFAFSAYFGVGVSIDFVAAARYFGMAADLGNAVAMRNYALCLGHGQGVPKDLAASARYCRMAADLGHAPAMYEYACRLVSGRGVEEDSAAAERYFRMAAESGDPLQTWKVATRLRDGSGVPKDEGAACEYFSRVEASTNVARLAALAGKLRCGWGVQMDIGESLCWYRRCADLGNVESLDHLGFCYEKGIGVAVDLSEAVKLYQKAADMGRQPARLSLGVFHWRGIGGFSVDRQEAVRLWRSGGLEIPDSLISSDTGSASSDSADRSSRFSSSKLETEETGTNRKMTQRSSLDEMTQIISPQPRSNQETDARTNETFEAIVFPSADRDEASPGSIQLNSLCEDPPGAAYDSFALSHSGRVIESLVLVDDRSARDFLGEGPPAREIAKLAGEGIRREGLRSLDSSCEGEQGNNLCEEMTECDTIESLLQVCAQFYTRDTFLFRRVNKFLRSGTEADPVTARNLGLYTGLLRECFCVRGQLNPLSWERPQVVYRGANFSIDILADYARRPDELIDGRVSRVRVGIGELVSVFQVMFSLKLLSAIAWRRWIRFQCSRVNKKSFSVLINGFLSIVFDGILTVGDGSFRLKRKRAYRKWNHG